MIFNIFDRILGLPCHRSSPRRHPRCCVNYPAMPAAIQPLEARQLLSATPVIVDNSDPAFSDVRTWQDLAGQGNQGSIATAANSVAGAFASWNFTNLENGQYYLQATWIPGTDRATNATFTSRSEFGSPGRTFILNQRLTPTPDFQSGSTCFQNLGVITVTDDKLTVELTNPGADGTVVADAIRLAPVPSTDNSVLVRTERLNAIVQALNTFQNIYGHLPPVATPSALDANGHYNLSWRVHLLPFLGDNDLYQQFHLNEPWNSANNLPLLNQMPDVFRSLDLAAGSGSTGFQRVDVPGGFHITGAGGPKFEGQTDNLITSLLLIETAAAKAVPWTAPDDSPYSPTNPLSIITPAPPDFILAATADSQIHHLNPHISAADFQAIVTWSGGEIISADRLPNIFVDTPLSPDQISQNNLQTFYNALHNYQDVFGSFAPGSSSTYPQFYDASQNPYLSWRVHILPFVGEQTLFNKFHLNEPWDSPNNLPLAAQMPEVFRSIGIAPGSNVTGYQIFNGPGAYNLHAPTKLRWSDMVDGFSNTLAVIELPASSAAVWTRPDGDIQYNPATPLASLPQIPATGLWSVMFDGSLHRISPQITAPNLAALVSWAGHESMGPADLTNAFLAYPAPESIDDRELKLRQLGIAFHNYHDTYNSLPVSYGYRSYYDAAGKPYLSWRVYLLPYLDEQALFSQFHLDEPWNSPNNLPLLDKMPEIFRSRGLPAATHLTGFQVLTGTAAYNQRLANSDTGRGPSFGTINDNWSTTILVLETQASQAVEWTRPDGDITFDPANPLANVDLSGLENVPADGLLALTPYGSVLNIKPAVSPSDFKALATWHGQEVIDSTALDRSVFLSAQTFGTRKSALHQIGFALHDFNDSYGSFPTGATAFPTNFDANGNQKLSWRVYLLPYLGEVGLFNQFHLDEPWNSPNNLPLLDKMPEIFRTRGLPVGTNLTGFQFISGTAAYDPRVDKNLRLQYVTDGLSNTIGIIEAPPELAVPWSKPDDFPFNPPDPFAALRPYISDYVLAQFLDGWTKTVNPQSAPADLSALMTWKAGDISNYETGSLTPQIQILDSASKQYRIETDLADLGTYDAQSPFEVTFTVKNTGSKPLIISSVQLPTFYSLTSPLNPIAPGASANLKFKLNDTIGGIVGGLVTINSNVPDQPVLKFKITATGIVPFSIVLSKTSIPENLPAGSLVGTLIGTGSPPGTSYDHLFYNGSSLGSNPFFSIDSQGRLTTKSSFNFELQSSYTFTLVSLESTQGLALMQDFTITVTDVNDAPLLTSTGNPKLPTITEDPADALNTGMLVSQLIANLRATTGSLTDPDTNPLEGLAFSAADQTHGIWQYSLDNGSHWSDFGTVSASAALLLASDANTRLRFKPSANYFGSSNVTFVAWDQSAGTNGGTASVVSRGGSKPFSLGYDTASITITSVNDAPVLSAAGNPTLTSIPEDTLDAANPGTLVSQILANFTASGGTYTDDDPAPLKGIAVTSVANTNGTWQYTTDNGTNWLDFGAPTAAAARLLASAAGTRIRFRPNADFNGTATFQFVAWDQTAGTNGATGVATNRGGNKPYSSVVKTATLTITPVNDAPLLDNTATGVPTLTAIPRNISDATNTGTLVSQIITNFTATGGSFTDVDAGALKGIAVTNVNNTNGTWEYTTDNGTNWTPFGTPTASAARLLASAAGTKMRFRPNTGFSGTSTFLFVGWDQSTGTNGSTAIVTSRGGTKAFSLGSDTGSISVFIANNAPVLNTNGNPTLTSIAKNTPDAGNTGTLVSQIIANLTATGGGITDPDAGALQGIAITSVNNANGTWQYTLNNGTTWLDFGSPAAATARLLASDANTRIRFKPAANYTGPATFLFVAWDQSSGVNGGTLSATTRGNATPFSTGYDTASISITST